jgi:hypothetical protein
MDVLLLFAIVVLIGIVVLLLDITKRLRRILGEVKAIFFEILSGVPDPQPIDYEADDSDDSEAYFENAIEKELASPL